MSIRSSYCPYTYPALYSVSEVMSFLPTQMSSMHVFESMTDDIVVADTVVSRAPKCYSGGIDVVSLVLAVPLSGCKPSPASGH